MTTPRVIVIGKKDSDAEEVANYMVGKAYYTSSVCPITVRQVEPGKVEYREVRRIQSKWSDMELVRVPYDLKLIKRYIEHPSSVIVVAMSVSKELPIELLDLVSRVDPKGERTVGVLTWIERLSAVQVAQMLIGDTLQLPFKLVGFARDVTWLRSHPVYATLPFGCTGTDAVIAQIGKALKHIVVNGLDRAEMPRHIRNEWN